MTLSIEFVCKAQWAHISSCLGLLWGVGGWAMFFDVQRDVRCPAPLPGNCKSLLSFFLCLDQGPLFDVVCRDTGYNFLFHLLFCDSSRLSTGWQTLHQLKVQKQLMKLIKISSTHRRTMAHGKNEHGKRLSGHFAAGTQGWSFFFSLLFSILL